MGVWGTGSFENDDALDWVGALAAESALMAAACALESAQKPNSELPDCCVALAAAEVVAVAHGNPATDLPKEVRTFALPRPDEALRQLATTVVHNVLAGSELLELWEESESGEEWKGKVADLLARLG